MPDITSHHHQLVDTGATRNPERFGFECSCGDWIWDASIIRAGTQFRDHQRRGVERYITEVLLEGWGEPLLFIPAVTSTHNDGFIDRIYLDNENNRAIKITITPEFVVHNYTMEYPE